MVGAATTAGLSSSTIQVIEAMVIEPLSVCVIRDGKICYVLREELTPAPLPFGMDLPRLF